MNRSAHLAASALIVLSGNLVTAGPRSLGHQALDEFTSRVDEWCPLFRLAAGVPDCQPVASARLRPGRLPDRGRCPADHILPETPAS
jgi:hypothetical protein